jgi:hypothetical protein
MEADVVMVGESEGDESFADGNAVETLSVESPGELVFPSVIEATCAVSLL